MKTQLVNNSTILVHLDRNDLEALKLEPLSLDFRKESVRNLLLCLLEQVEASLGHKLPPQGKTVVEVLPFENGECLISYSKHRESAPKLRVTAHKKGSRAYVYSFWSEEALRAFLSVVHSPYQAYHLDGEYRVILPHLTDRVRLIAGEFAQEVRHPLAVAYTKEHYASFKPY